MNLTCKINHFHTIDKANIMIDGITLVTGSHSTGKSMLLNFIYDIIRFPVYFTSYRTDKFWGRLDEVYDHLIFLWKTIVPVNDTETEPPSFMSLYSSGGKKAWIQFIDQLEMYYLENCRILQSDILLTDHAEKIRYRNIYPDDYTKDYFMHLIGLDRDPETFPDHELFEATREFIYAWFMDKDTLIRSRSLDLLLKNLYKKYPTERGLPDFRIKEGDTCIVDNQQDSFEKFITLKNVLYIDNPMFFGSKESWYLTNWDYIYKAFLSVAGKKRQISEEGIEFLHELIQGEVIQDLPPYTTKGYQPLIPKLDFTDFPDEWFSYKRNDGEIIPLSKCTADLKTFILLERLLVNGLLDENTLVIFNDPENNLCPEQIEGIASFISRLHDRCGVRFLISSYNPQLTKAITLACEEEGIIDKLNRFEAIPSNAPYHYIFR